MSKTYESVIKIDNYQIADINSFTLEELVFVLGIMSGQAGIELDTSIELHDIQNKTIGFNDLAKAYKRRDCVLGIKIKDEKGIIDLLVASETDEHTARMTQNIVRDIQDSYDPANGSSVQREIAEAKKEQAKMIADLNKPKKNKRYNKNTSSNSGLINDDVEL